VQHRMFKTKEVSLVDKIRAIQKSDKANKQCANCAELGPVYICTDFMTFVCTECSGVHRELSHKVKSISMSNWTKEEIDELESRGGNQRDHDTFMLSYDPKVFPLPQSTNRSRLREFVKAKYVERLWTGKSAIKNDNIERSPQKPTKSLQTSSRQSPQAIPPADVDLFSFSNTSVTHNEAQMRDKKSHISPDRTREILTEFLDSLDALNRSHPTEARHLANSAISRVNDILGQTQPVSVTGIQATVPSATSSGVSVNPFDFHPDAASQQSSVFVNSGVPNHNSGLIPTMSPGPSWLMSSQVPSAGLKPAEVVRNPFDDLI
jgi:hypothetical protein